MEHLNEGKPGINNVSDDKGKKNHKAEEEERVVGVDGWRHTA